MVFKLVGVAYSSTLVSPGRASTLYFALFLMDSFSAVFPTMFLRLAGKLYLSNAKRHQQPLYHLAILMPSYASYCLSGFTLPQAG